MIHETFASGNSLFHRLDPRFKIVSSVGYSSLIAFSSQFLTLFLFLGISLLMVFISDLKISQVAKRIVLVNGMIFFCWLVLPITANGPSLYDFGIINIKQPGILLASRLTLKSNAILLGLIVLVSTSSVASLGYSMENLFFPKKLIFLLFLTYRYLFVFEQEYQKLITAAKVRCFRPANNVLTYKTYAYLIGMLFVRASIKGDRVYQAMLCRGFNGRFHTIHEFTTSWRDWLFSGCMIIILIGLGILEWGRII